jgi:hypothetical protein
MRIHYLLILPLLLVSFVGYKGWNYESADESGVIICKCTYSQDSITSYVGSRALLASRFQSTDELKSVIEIDYFKGNSPSVDADSNNTMVLLKHCSNGIQVTSDLESGISQKDISDVARGDFFDKAGLVFSSPYAVTNRMLIYKIFNLARRRPNLFGEGDVAFYDLALVSANNINTNELAYLHHRDSSEKGYINTFNHITAQALITSIFSEDMADFISDVHERNNMPELTTGRFTKEQLEHPDDNPVDNYVDMINNEWGQELGKKLRKKYAINPETIWTRDLLADYLNEIQSYYSRAFQIGFKPFSSDDEMIAKFTYKINKVMSTKILR